MNYYYSGNEYISLINIEENLSINGLTFLSMGLNGNVFIDCKIYLKIFNKAGPVDFKNASFNMVNYWIPEIIIKTRGSEEIRINLLTPKEQRGFIYNITGKNIRAELHFEYKNLFLNINASHKLDPLCEIYDNKWFNQAVYKFLHGSSLFCIAVDAGKKGTYKIMKNKIIASCSGKSGEINFNVGISTEDMGAISSCVHFRRFGYDYFHDELNDWLSEKVSRYENKNVEKIYNTSLFFNYFFSNGKTIDTDDIVCVTSRSPEYYVSGAYWDRDAFLWSFPAILIIDDRRAREMLDYAFKIQGKNFGVHSRQINGNMLECGFELDELCAPFLALKSYINKTGDTGLLEKEEVNAILSHIKDKFFKHKHKVYMLFKTELRPSDDMSSCFYNTYDNVLTWQTFITLSYFHKLLKNDKESMMWKKMAQTTRNDLKKFSIDKKNRIISYEFDTKGKHILYEEPPGSLRLLEFYGFIDNDIRPYYKKTMKWSYSKQNPYFYYRKICESGCEHAKYPWPLSAANSLFTTDYKRYGIDFFKKCKMDNYYACESVDGMTGRVKTGKAFATAAGFIAFAIKKGIN